MYGSRMAWTDEVIQFYSFTFKWWKADLLFTCQSERDNPKASIEHTPGNYSYYFFIYLSDLYQADSLVKCVVSVSAEHGGPALN